MFFKQGQFGWTESHIYTKSASETLLAVEEECIKYLCPLRAKLLGAGAELFACRVSYNLKWRDSQFATSRGAGAGVINAPLSDYGKAHPADNPYSVTTVRMTAGDDYRKLVYVSGQPAATQPYPSDAPFPDDYKVDWNKYFAYLAGQSSRNSFWGSIFSTKPADNPPVPNILTATFTAGPPSIMTYGINPVPVNLKPGAKVRILGIKYGQGGKVTRINGVFPVDTVGALNFTVRLDEPLDAMFPVDCRSAYYHVIDQTAVAYTDYEWENQTHRKRGRPFGGPAGRSRTR